jgi:hypothetical protein
MSNTSTSTHRWKFFRAGGFDQLRFESGADLLALENLDQKLWAALACPTRGMEFDNKTLDLIDTDKDGRVRAPEVIAAVKWTGSLLRDPGELLKGNDELPLMSINDATPEGKQILSSARADPHQSGQKGRPGDFGRGHDRHRENFCRHQLQRRWHCARGIRGG